MAKTTPQSLFNALHAGRLEERNNACRWAVRRINVNGTMGKIDRGLFMTEAEAQARAAEMTELSNGRQYVAVAR